MLLSPFVSSKSATSLPTRNCSHLFVKLTKVSPEPHNVLYLRLLDDHPLAGVLPWMVKSDKATRLYAVSPFPIHLTASVARQLSYLVSC